MIPILFPALFVGLAFAGSLITRRALGRLTAEEKVHLVDASARTPLAFTAVFGVLVVAVLLGLWLYPEYGLRIVETFLAAILVLSAVAAVNTYSRLARHGLPPSFLRSFTLSRCLRLLGAAVLFTALALYYKHTV
jgi:hypothetical protein